ncbi:helix-turn-helix domain-containing protein [Pseudochryseolinea flava]|uniref:HTH araC/xylS-type domain-containing protein n=1 Tax=Pseudochryseolinea flava TaxID=2059302 RepID=A0A364Y1X3_9BACT|nr:helix-turn-helix transcriptional regulator [Pseudochryseolinea flava]RAW00738.1 hypothetical protein DQQ10_14260 [Pseudochryseolinea flava]
MQSTIVYAITSGSLFLLLLATLATPRKVNVSANFWLALFLFSFACIMLDHALYDLQVYRAYPMLAGYLEVTRFAMAPALYFSVCYFTTPERKFQRPDYLHFVPAALFILFVLAIVIGLNESRLFSWYYTLSLELRRGIGFGIFVALKVQMIVYWVLSYVSLRRHFKNVQLFASTIESISLSWLRYFLLGLGAVLVLSLNDVLLWIPALVPFTHFGYLALTFYLAYFSLRQQEVYPYQPQAVADIQNLIEGNDKAPRVQRFTTERLGVAKQQLVQTVESEKLYLDPNLGLPQLAARLQWSTHDLSYLINEGFGENFFQFINRYRIEEAKVLLTSPNHKHLNILGIAYECGFRSKSTFNTTFKKLTGVSPSEFMTSAKPDTEKAA